MKVSFIGLGIMGSRMAKNLLKNNAELKVYNRNKEHVKDEILRNILSNSAAECVKDSDFVFTMLSTPEAVEETAYGEKGFIDTMKKKSLWIDCSTVDPAFSKKMFELSKAKDIRFIDIPVSGSKIPAENAELIFLAGAKDEEINELRELLMFMGSKIIAGGERGNGSNLKMLINAMLGDSMAMFSETVALGTKMGFDKDKLIDLLSGLSVTPPFIKLKTDMMKNDTYIVNFPLEWMHKDMHLVGKTADELKQPVYIANLVEELFAKAKNMGFEREDFAAIFKLLNKDVKE